MPRGPRNGVVASCLLKVLVTPAERGEYFALAKFLDVKLAELIRGLLARERARLERAGSRVPKKLRRRSA